MGGTCMPLGMSSTRPCRQSRQVSLLPPSHTISPVSRRRHRSPPPKRISCTLVLLSRSCRCHMIGPYGMAAAAVVVADLYNKLPHLFA